VRDGLTLSKQRAEHPMLTLIELIQVNKKHEKLTLACKGDTLPALLVWFHHNLAGFSNSNNDFCCFLSVITPVMMALTHCWKLIKFYAVITCQRGSARQCCKGHVSFLWEKPIFDPSQKPNPLSYNHKNIHD
jgi:hypothetical protein